MEKLIIILCFLFIPSLCSAAWTLPFSEDCESGVFPYGFDGSSTDAGCTISEYTGANKNDTKAIQAYVDADSGGYAFVYENDGSAAESPIWAMISFWVDNELIENGDFDLLIEFNVAGCGTNYATVSLAQNGSGDLVLRGDHGTGNAESSSVLSLDTEYVIKAKYILGSGADGVLEIYQKIPSGSYTRVVNIINGSSTTGIGCVKFGYSYCGINDDTTVQLDDFKIQTTDPDPEGGQVIIVN